MKSQSMVVGWAEFDLEIKIWSVMQY